MSNIYLASSWRNPTQPALVAVLREAGHTVYDFRHPTGLDSSGFSWASIDPNWKLWTPAEYRQALRHPLAVQGYENDITALKNCDTCVLLLPSGRSASWELGFAHGQGKRCIVALFEPVDPDLMYFEHTIVTTMTELLEALEKK